MLRKPALIVCDVSISYMLDAERTFRGGKLGAVNSSGRRKTGKASDRRIRKRDNQARREKKKKTHTQNTKKHHTPKRED